MAKSGVKLISVVQESRLVLIDLYERIIAN